jgi:hypothetical protein
MPVEQKLWKGNGFFALRTHFLLRGEKEGYFNTHNGIASHPFAMTDFPFLKIPFYEKWVNFSNSLRSSYYSAVQSTG